jgi:hypothetical protein
MAQATLPRPPFRVREWPSSHRLLPKSTKEFHLTLDDAHFAQMGQKIVECDATVKKHRESHFRLMANEDMYVLKK